MAFARTVLLGATVALASGGMMAGSASAAPAEASPDGPRSAASAGGTGTSGGVDAAKVTKHVWRNAPSYYGGYSRAGTLFAGNNYFYCQAQGKPYHYGEYKNHWWLLTDDDNGNTNVWVPAVFISGGDNYEPIAGVPKC